MGRRLLMTPTFDPTSPQPSAGLFRPAKHVLVWPQGSALAILDLDRGLCYAATPVGADSWNMLVAAREARSGNGLEVPKKTEEEDPHSWVRVAAYLLDRCIIEPAG
jgi:hypothetical protein